MKDLALRGVVGAQNASSRFIHNLRNKFEENAERGDVVQNVIMIAIFAVGAVLIGGFIINSLTTQGTKISGCINNINTGTCAKFKP